MSVLWRPTKTWIEQTHLVHFMEWLEQRHDISLSDYQELWTWSTQMDYTFWADLFEYFDVQYSGSIDVKLSGQMPGARWFPDSTLNYVEHIMRRSTPDREAIISKIEDDPVQMWTWSEVWSQVAALQRYLLACGVQPGDRVVAYIPNVPRASMMFLATAGLGAVWSSCSPDFGDESVIDRFEQVKPKVLIAASGYDYGGKSYDRVDQVKRIMTAIDGLDHLLVIDDDASWDNESYASSWPEPINEEVIINRVPFGHPIWILFSSGTTGVPKAITHGHGGALLEHLKYMAFHNDVHAGERFFWYSTTGWMMWNFVHASWLMGATVVLYDGSPAYPSLDQLWSFTSEVGINHFGTSAPFLVACMNRGLSPADQFDLSSLRSIGSTGSPLPPEAFSWVYEHISPKVWLCSMSGGTDVCTAFVGGCPIKPVRYGEIQCRALGCHLEAWDDEGHPLLRAVGEMVITKPMPSMPIYFWGDDKMKRYRESYFDYYPNVWRHGDWVEITEHDGVIIYGRSDATLNRQGVRIGTSEVYRVINEISSIEDALIVNLELSGGQHYMPLFVQLADGEKLNDELINNISTSLRRSCSPRHVPDEVIQVEDIPYTISGKKMEAPVKKILLGRVGPNTLNKGAMKNPESLEFYIDFAEVVKNK